MALRIVRKTNPIALFVVHTTRLDHSVLYLKKVLYTKKSNRVKTYLQYYL